MPGRSENEPHSSIYCNSYRNFWNDWSIKTSCPVRVTATFQKQAYGVEVTFSLQHFFRVSFALLLRRLFLPHFMRVLISERAVHSPFESSFSRKLLDTDSFSEQHASRFDGRPGQGCIWNGGCILIREKCLAGMIFSREIHPDLMETSGSG